MQNYLLTLAYDGTNYCGFQVQPNGRSVAQTFQDGLEAVLHSRPDIKGCRPYQDLPVPHPQPPHRFTF